MSVADGTSSFDVAGLGDTVCIPYLRVLLRQRLGPTRFWYDEELEWALLEALRVWQAMTGNITMDFGTAPQGMQYEQCPGQIARPTRVTFAGPGGELDKISLWELDEGFIGWEGTASGTPIYWAHCGFNEIVFYPRPTYAVAEIKYEGISDIDRGWLFGVPLDVLSVGDVEALLGYAQHYLSFKEGAGELDNTQGLLQNFYKRAGEANTRLRRMNFFRASMGVDRGEDEGSRSAQGNEGGMR